MRGTDGDLGSGMFATNKPICYDSVRDGAGGFRIRVG